MRERKRKRESGREIEWKRTQNCISHWQKAIALKPTNNFMTQLYLKFLEKLNVKCYKPQNVLKNEIAQNQSRKFRYSVCDARRSHMETPPDFQSRKENAQERKRPSKCLGNVPLFTSKLNEKRQCQDIQGNNNVFTVFLREKYIFFNRKLKLKTISNISFSETFNERKLSKSKNYE